MAMSLAVAALALLVYIQGSVTWLVVSSDEDPVRKVLQCCLIWILPLIGAVLVGYFAMEYRRCTKAPQPLPLLVIPVVWIFRLDGGGDAAGGPLDPHKEDQLESNTWSETGDGGD